MNVKELAQTVRPGGRYQVHDFSRYRVYFKQLSAEFQKQLVELQTSSNKLLLNSVYEKADSVIIQRIMN